MPPVGSTWVLHSLDGRPVIEGSFVALKVYQDGTGAYGGCNRIGLGPITFPGEPVDKKPYFGPGGVIHHTGSSKTDRGCIGPGGLAEQEEGYWRALIEGNLYRLEDDRIEVFDTNGALRLVFYRQEPLPGQQIDLEGTAWRQMDDEAVTLSFLMEQEARYLGLLPKLTLYGVYGDALYMRTNDDIFLLFGAE